MGWLHRLHAVVWGAATIAMLALWVRSYWVERPDEVALMKLQYGGISFTSMAGRVTTHLDFSWSWPVWMEFGAWPYGHSAGFGAMPICDRLFITTPHWFFILLCAAATWYLAWPSYRFSVRTLLVLTGVVAVLIGSWIACDRPTLPSDGIFW